VWSLPDTPANLEQFGWPSNNHGSGAWSQLRAVCLVDTYISLIRAASFGDYRTGELSFAAPLMHAQSGEPPITTVSVGYFCQENSFMGVLSIKLRSTIGLYARQAGETGLFSSGQQAHCTAN
jgi:hypothetical protein